MSKLKKIFFRDHFDILAPFYDLVIRQRNPEKLIVLLGLPLSGSLLDAGGGTGRISQFFPSLVDNLVLADLSFPMLRQAKMKKDLQAVCSPTERLPFPDESFDRILMVDALHHVVDQKKSALELWRVLKSGGRIVIEEPDIRYFSVKLVALAEKLTLMRSHFLSPHRIQSLFAYPNALVYIEKDNPNFWLIVEKQRC